VGRPSDLIVYLKEDLVVPEMQYKTDPGNRMKVTRILRQLLRRVEDSVSKRMEIYLDRFMLKALKQNEEK